ncbi:HIRAN domain-containing protein [Baekduia sp.]|uniref:HIRAN domain-containing protein n=1 Tax=Baekduia sp. TaxID=2600305 RepID=UPI0039C8AF24
MGLFNRSPAHARLPRGRFAPLPEENFIRVVGESYCQRELTRLRDRCVPGVEGRPSFPVALVPEPDKPYDPQAVAVIAEVGRVGYLPRDDAQRYAPTLRALVDRGFDGASCTGLLNGGETDRPSFGVVLTLSYPEACEQFVSVPT